MTHKPITYPPEFADAVQDAIELLDAIAEEEDGPMQMPHPVAERLRIHLVRVGVKLRPEIAHGFPSTDDREEPKS